MNIIDKTILLVEDDDIARDVLELILKKYFSTVVVAANGKIGLEKSEEFKPDLIIADLAMPVVDGFVMLKTLEKNFTETPVVIVTAYREEAKKCGDYKVLHKPVDRKELINTICEILKVEVSH